MKCKFEHGGDCCNCGSPQYMCKCKSKICNSAAPMTNADRIRAMSDEELCFLFVNTERFANLINVSYAEMLDWLRQPAEGEQHG